MLDKSYPIWHKSDGTVVSCLEKLKVMQENLDELQILSQDLFEDAILMEVDDQQLRQYLIEMMQHLINPYKETHV